MRMTQTSSPAVSVGQFLFVDSFADDGIFLSIDLVPDIGQHIVFPAFLIKAIGKFFVIGSYHIEDQDLVFLEVALIIDVERRTVVMTAGLVEHIYIVRFIRPIDQLSFETLDRYIVPGIIEGYVELVFIIVLQVVSYVQPLLHQLPV